MIAFTITGMIFCGLVGCCFLYCILTLFIQHFASTKSLELQLDQLRQYLHENYQKKEETK